MFFDRSTIVLIFLSLIICISCKSLQNSLEDSNESYAFDDDSKDLNLDSDTFDLLNKIINNKEQLEDENDDSNNDYNYNNILNDKKFELNNDDLEIRHEKRDTTYNSNSRIIKGLTQNLHQPNKR
jgi:hypothetical protein